MTIGKGCSICGAFIETIDGGVVMCDECLRRLRGILYPPKKVYCKHCQLNNGKSCEILGVPIVVDGWCSHTDYEWNEEEQAYILKTKQTENGARMDGEQDVASSED